jgi:hypothetical protein
MISTVWVGARGFRTWNPQEHDDTMLARKVWPLRALFFTYLTPPLTLPYFVADTRWATEAFIISIMGAG